MRAQSKGRHVLATCAGGREITPSEVTTINLRAVAIAEAFRDPQKCSDLMPTCAYEMDHLILSLAELVDDFAHAATGNQPDALTSLYDSLRVRALNGQDAP